MSFIYRRERLESGWTFFNVMDGASVVGRILRDRRSGKYRFFPGADNALVFQFEHGDLDELKVFVERGSWQGKPEPYLPLDLDPAGR